MDSATCIKKFAVEYQFKLQSESLKIYQDSINLFLSHTGKTVDAVSKQDIRRWLRHLADSGYKPNTIWSKLTGLKTFFKYCQEEGISSSNPAEEIPYPIREESLPYYLTVEQIVQLRQLLVGRQPIERAIVEVLYATGVRISELCAMKKEDIKWSERIILIPKGKGKKGRIVLFTRECETYLLAYLDSRKDKGDYVFASPKRGIQAIHLSTVEKWFRNYSKELGIRITPHTMRHTFSAHLAKKGMPFEYIQALLGHEDPEQTRFYARLYNQARKDLYDEWM